MQQTTFLFVQVLRSFKRLATHAIFSLIRFLVNISRFLAPPPHLLRGQLVTLFGGTNKSIVGDSKRFFEFFKPKRVAIGIGPHFLVGLLCRFKYLLSVLVGTGTEKNLFPDKAF